MDNEQAPIIRDSNGTALANGDSVMVIKDLNVKGSSGVIKRGTVAKNISLTDDPEHIEYGSGRSKMALKTCFVKKV